MSSFSSQSSRSGLASHTDTARLEALSRSDKLKRVRTGHQQASHRERVNDGYRPKPSNSMRPEASLCSLQNRIRTPNPAQSLSHQGHIDHKGHASPASCRSSSGRGSPFRSRIKFGAYLPQFPQRPDSPASSSSCNEALGPAAPSHFIRQSAEFQTCNTPYLASSSINAFRRSTPRQDIQVPPDLTDSSLSSSPQLVLFPNTPNLPHLLRPNPTYAYLQHSGSVSSFDTTSSVPSPPRLRSPHPETSSPSASPRSRKAGSPSSTPSQLSPVAFLIRRGLVPQRAQPTLAMSIQIHTPTPIIASRPLSPPNSRPNPHSKSTPTSPLGPAIQLPPTKPPMTRPSSRSEKMLRDALRRADEQERLANLSILPSPHHVGAPNPHGFIHTHIPTEKYGGRNRIRRSTSSSAETSTSSEADYPVDDECDEEDREWLWRSRATASGSGSSSASGNNPASNYFHNTQNLSRSTHHSHARHTSVDRDQQGPRSRRSHTDPLREGFDPSMAYGTPTSPTPARAQLHRSPNSAPNVSRASRRTSVEGRRHDGASVTHGYNEGAITPHDAVLRSRLEGVLRGAKQQERRTRSRERGGSGSGSGTGSGNSMASSRNLSGDGEWFFANGEGYTTSPLNDPSLTANGTSRANFSPPRPPTLNLPRSPKSTHTSPVSPHKVPSPSSPRRSAGPLTPPATPQFDPRTASVQCRAMNGYVSFANIEGLGVPEGDDDYCDDEDDKGGNRWFPWFKRGRSDSASSFTSP